MTHIPASIRAGSSVISHEAKITKPKKIGIAQHKTAIRKGFFIGHQPPKNPLPKNPSNGAGGIVANQIG
jgi:hypothetical protein